MPALTTQADDAELGSVLVVVPVRDEVDRIEVCLASVAVALRRVAGVQHSVVVVDDSSVDGTGAHAQRVMDDRGMAGQVVRVDVGQASSARAAGIRSALPRLDDPRRTWLLSTDGDCVVPSDWVSRHLGHAERGAAAVAGVVSLLDDQDGRLVNDRWRKDYGATLRADGSHPHVHSANLGVRLDHYMAVGGFAPLDRAEDIDLWKRLRAADLPIVADARICVQTSARLDGRVDEGFAGALRRLYGEPIAQVSR